MPYKGERASLSQRAASLALFPVPQLKGVFSVQELKPLGLQALLRHLSVAELRSAGFALQELAPHLSLSDLRSAFSAAEMKTLGVAKMKDAGYTLSQSLDVFSKAELRRAKRRGAFIWSEKDFRNAGYKEKWICTAHRNAEHQIPSDLVKYDPTGLLGEPGKCSACKKRIPTIERREEPDADVTA